MLARRRPHVLCLTSSSLCAASRLPVPNTRSLPLSVSRRQALGAVMKFLVSLFLSFISASFFFLLPVLSPFVRQPASIQPRRYKWERTHVYRLSFYFFPLFFNC